MNATVKAVQRGLLARGYDLGPVDGIAGDKTWKAIADALGVADEPQANPAVMTTSPAGRKAIKQREGEVLTAYLDSVGILTIGVGHTSAAGAPVVTKGMKITAAESDDILSRDLKTFETGVRDAVTVPLSQNEFDALVSLAFNIGVSAFSKSTLVKKLNAGDRAGAAVQFLVWDKAKGKTQKGLTTRRKSERDQFLSA